MGRIRTIKPEFPQSESMGRCSREARFLFVLLWTLVDDSGRTRAASRMLASLLYPYDDDAPRLIEGWLCELVNQQCIVLYEVDGHRYLEVRNWQEHQRIDRPSKSKFPPFDESSRALASPREPSSLDQGPRTKDQGPVQAPPAAVAPTDEAEPKQAAASRPDDVPEQVWKDWLAHRRKKRATVSQTVLDGTRREAAAAGMTLADAMRHSMTQGWNGFRAEWVKPSSSNGTVPPRLVAASTQHIPNMPLGAASCQCQGCIEFRAKRA